VLNTYGGSVEEIFAQPDGKLLVVGNFTVVGATARSNIARLNADGTIDSTFDPPDFIKLVSGYIRSLDTVSIRAVAVQPDGKILVGGDFTSVNDVPRARLARLNADGSLDPTLNNVAMTVPFGDGPPIIYDIEVQSDGRILIGGYFLVNQNGTSRNALAR
jgi:uncharacterized delta-60 repeat protein